MDIKIPGEKINALRMQRQYLADKKAGKKEYDKLFRDMSPVPVRYWSAPGDPPSISSRADFDDFEYNFKLRKNRDIVKGRFQNGSVGYVAFDELELFIGLYKKDRGRLSRMQFELLDLIEHEDGITINRIKKATGYFVKNITPELHKLQEAFIIFEDQTDNEGDRMWFTLESVFPEIDIKKYTQLEALKIVLKRFAKLNILFDASMARSFYKLNLNFIKQASDELVNLGEFVNYNNIGYMLKSDFDYLNRSESDGLKLPKSVIVMHRNDFLVKSNENRENQSPRLLKEKFKHEKYGVLQYILIDGEFHGALFGNFKFGPSILEDIILDLSDSEKISRKDEILNAIYEHHDREASPLKKYCGK
ncbi:MAG: hypothetical protein FWF92_04675 [Oscillospiraceae bacterium]|nr:hypothetical protein [Oscillospiraceae bacterium]